MMAFTESEAQELHISASGIPLSEVFYSLRDRYDLQFVFSPDVLDSCIVDLHQNFSTAKSAIAVLTDNCNLNYEYKNGVFYIKSRAKQDASQKPSNYLFRGIVRDRESGESLPSALLVYENISLSTNDRGYFAWRSTDSLVHVHIRYLGYAPLDTTLSFRPHHEIYLSPNTALFATIEVDAKEDSMTLYDSAIDKMAAVRLNHQVSRFLPGNLGNGIYNMLRLQPGIMASGEQSDNFTIWGSYDGQSPVYFDYIRLYSMSGLSESQSLIHPLMIKEVKIQKGGYGVAYGNSVGGVIEVLGKEGNVDRFSADLQANNQAISAYTNVPITDEAVLQLAYRKTFKDPININRVERRKFRNLESFVPEESFDDFNIKFRTEIQNKGLLQANYLQSREDYSYEYTHNGEQLKYTESTINTEIQRGASLSYHHAMNNGGNSLTVCSGSTLGRDHSFYNHTETVEPGSEDMEIDSRIGSNISEWRMLHKYTLPLQNRQQWEFGLEYVNNQAQYENDNKYIGTPRFVNQASRWSLLAEDRWEVSSKLGLKLGLRADYLTLGNKWFVQPRAQLQYLVNARVSLHAAIGTYRQYLAKVNIYDASNSIFSLWEILNTEIQDPTSSHHYVLGIETQYMDWHFRLESFVKNSNNIYGFFQIPESQRFVRRKWNANSQGIDLHVKKNIAKHECSLAYTYTSVNENIDRRTASVSRTAPHSQTHELKLMAIFDFHPLYFSSNFVHGSGLSFTRFLNNDEPIPYNRLDLGIMHQINLAASVVQVGLSLQNALNASNIKYTNTINRPDRGYALPEALPFTVLINLGMSF